MFSGDGGSARSFAIILIVHLAVIVLWQVLVDAFQVPKFILPSPLATIKTLASPNYACLLYTSPSPRDGLLSRMPSSA